MKTKRLSSVLWVLLALGVAYGPSRAHAQLPPPVVLPVPTVTQDTMVWCWLAVSEMVIRYRNWGAGFRQCQMMEVGYRVPPGTCCGNPNLCARPGSIQEIQGVIASFGGRFSSLAPPTNYQVLYNILQSGRPVIAQIATGGSIGHVVVIRGMGFQPFINMLGMPDVAPILMINDPMSIVPAQVPYAQFLAIWRASIIVH